MRLTKGALSPVPLYFKVMTEIRDNILSGAWNRGFQLPGELNLARHLGVSVITIRQALARLSEEGLIRRERAKGTFVTWSGPVNQAINLEIEAENLVTLNPEGTSFKLLGTEKVVQQAELQREFNLLPKENLMRITRVRMALGHPLAYVHSYVKSRFADRLSPKSLLKLPLSSAIEDAFRIKITDVRHLIAAKLADDEVSAHLEIPPGSPVLFVERNYFCKKELVLRTLGFYRSDLFRYELKLKGRGR
jgi:GntR family transcriptional regulator